MPVFNGSAKDYAAENGIGQKGRGRPSADALAFIAKARAEGWTFSKETVTPKDNAPKESKPKAPAKEIVARESYDPKAVRKWAGENGLEVAARGRVDSDIVRQYLDAMQENGTTVEKRVVTAVNAKDIRPEAPRTIRAGTKFQGEVNGKTVTVSTDRLACQNSGYSISHCGCPGGNHIVSLGGTSSVPISPLV